MRVGHFWTARSSCFVICVSSSRLVSSHTTWRRVSSRCRGARDSVMALRQRQRRGTGGRSSSCAPFIRASRTRSLVGSPKRCSMPCSRGLRYLQLPHRRNFRLRALGPARLAQLDLRVYRPTVLSDPRNVDLISRLLGVDERHERIGLRHRLAVELHDDVACLHPGIVCC